MEHPWPPLTQRWKTTRTPPLHRVPNDVLIHIFEFVRDLHDLIGLYNTSHAFRERCTELEVWKIFRHLGIPYVGYYSYPSLKSPESIPLKTPSEVIDYYLYVLPNDGPSYGGLPHGELPHAPFYGDNNIFLGLLKRNLTSRYPQSVSHLLHLYLTARGDSCIIDSTLAAKVLKIQVYGWFFFTQMSPKIQMSKKHALLAVKACGQNLKHVGEALTDDRDIVIAAVKQDGSALQYASRRLRSDLYIVEKAVKKSYAALEWADASLKCDREIVLHAVRQCGIALGSADESLRRYDREIVLAAVRQSWRAIHCIPEDSPLLEDEEICRTAYATCRKASEVMSDRMKLIVCK